LDLVTRVTGTAITVIRVTDMGIIHMDTTDHIRTMVITAPRTGIGFTATTVIITTGIGTKLALGVKPSIKSIELARKRFRASFFSQSSRAIPARLSSAAKTLSRKKDDADLNLAFNSSGR
jgi:hypothetical protein